MKTYFKAIFLLLCVLVLTACTNPFAKTEIVQVQERETQKVYSCNELKSKTARENCINEASSMTLDALNSEIIRTFDVKRCVELPQEMADICVKRIQESGVKGPVSEAEVSALKEAMRLSYKALEGEEGEMMEENGYYDIAKCATLTTSGLKEYCEKQLNRRIEEDKVFKIVESGDAAKCDELTDESFVRMCKMELGVYIEEEMAEPEVDVSEPEVTNEPVEQEEDTESAEGEVMP